MKLYNSKIGTQTINISGHLVKFVNSIAEVDDALGAEILELGLPDLYENGKQPVYETPKEIRMKTDFAEKEQWYMGECERLKNIAEARKEKINELEAEVALWKSEFQKEHDARIALAESLSGSERPQVEGTQEQAPAAPENEEMEGDQNEAPTEEELREELKDMKKDELIKVAVESGLDEAEMKELKKAEIIDKIVELTKEA